MNISFETPAMNSRPYRSYAALIDLLQGNPGRWLCVDGGEVTGGTVNQKRTSLILAARRNHIKVKTRTEDGKIYIQAVLAATEVA